jgi:hypothetical protein
MRRLTLFVKGNVDVHDSLHSCRIGGELAWNGINDVLRVRQPGCTARLKHETLTRTDALLLSPGTVPAVLDDHPVPLGSYPFSSQFSHAIFEAKADAIVLSIQPDIATALVRHKRDGFLIYPSEAEHWSAADKQWLKSEFEPAEELDVAKSMENLTTIIGKIRKHTDAPILVYNVSPMTPGEEIHCYQGFGETYSTRIRRFNLALVELSEKTGVSIIDVDSVLARKGTDTLKLDTIHLTADGYRLVAEEVVRVLEDVGLFDEHG